MKQIYLDNNSTTLIDPDVVKTVTRCMESGYVNPASQHQPGQQSRRKLEQIRSEILGLVGGCNQGMETDSLIFTSGGTKATIWRWLVWHLNKMAGCLKSIVSLSLLSNIPVYWRLLRICRRKDFALRKSNAKKMVLSI